MNHSVSPFFQSLLICPFFFLCLSAHLFVCQSVHHCVCQHIFQSLFLSVCLFACFSYLPIHVNDHSMNLFGCLFLFWHIFLSLHVCLSLAVCLSVSMCICLPACISFNISVSTDVLPVSWSVPWTSNFI